MGALFYLEKEKIKAMNPDATKNVKMFITSTKNTIAKNDPDTLRIKASLSDKGRGDRSLPDNAVFFIHNLRNGQVDSRYTANDSSSPP